MSEITTFVLQNIKPDLCFTILNRHTPQTYLTISKPTATYYTNVICSLGNWIIVFWLVGIKSRVITLEQTPRRIGALEQPLALLSSFPVPGGGNEG